MQLIDVELDVAPPEHESRTVRRFVVEMVVRDEVIELRISYDLAAATTGRLNFRSSSVSEFSGLCCVGFSLKGDRKSSSLDDEEVYMKVVSRIDNELLPCVGILNSQDFQSSVDLSNASDEFITAVGVKEVYREVSQK